MLNGFFHADKDAKNYVFIKQEDYFADYLRFIFMRNLNQGQVVTRNSN